MASPTIRDRAWIETLNNLLGDGNAVTPEYLVNSAGVSERTARDTLKVMASEGFVEEDRIPDGRVRYVPTDVLDGGDDGDS